MKPDYNNSIACLPNSILKWFGIEDGIERKTLSLMDEELGLLPQEAGNKEEKEYKNVVVLLLDAMGMKALRDHLSPEGFFGSHLKGEYSSVFPPTTVAATTSVQCGLEPCTHGWLGWDCYFEPIEKNVTVFRNVETETGESLGEKSVAQTYCPYTSIVDIIRAHGGQAYNATPFLEPYPKNFEEIKEYIKKLCKEDGKKYIYSYWTEPDHTMHQTGVTSLDTRMMVRALEEEVERLAGELEDTLLIVTADHGHVNSEGVALEDYPELLACLKRMPSIEPRTLSFAIIEGKEKEFEALFKESFGEKFHLYTEAEIRKEKLFGEGEENPLFTSMLGDYVAVAHSDLSIYDTREQMNKFIGVHAGLSQDELAIPFIAISQ